MAGLIDQAHVEPLHLKNNLCARLHSQILENAIKKSKLPQNVNTFQKVSPQSPFASFVNSLKADSGLSRLSKIIRWFNETKATGKPFEYRFPGQESRRFLHNFMYLIRAIECRNDPDAQKFKLHVYAFICLTLRDAVSLYNTFNTNLEQLAQLTKACCVFYKCCALFLKVNPTIWTLGHLVTVHSKEVFAKFGKGLAINSMEGREAKHLAISRYAHNSTNCNGSQPVFRHDFVSLICLREMGHKLSFTKLNKETYIPKRFLQMDSAIVGFQSQLG